MKEPPLTPPNQPPPTPPGGREWKPIIHPWGDRGGLEGASVFMAKGHIFYRKVFFHFIMCGSSGTKSDVVVVTGLMNLFI